MESENSFARHIESAGSDAALDNVCKRLLANKSILAWIMRECIEEYRDCTVEEIAERYIEGQPRIGEETVHADESLPQSISGLNTVDSSINDGTVTYDICYEALLPGADEYVSIIINIEVQNNFYPGYPLIKRGIYYCGRMLSSQYDRYFTASNYDKLRKVYSIWICTNPPENKKNAIKKYSITESDIVGNAPKEEKSIYDLLSLIMIYLGDESKDNYGGIVKLLKVLLSEEIRAESKKEILRNEFEIKMTRDLESEVSEMCDISKGISARAMAKGLAEGMTKGLAEGRAKGIAEGRVEGRAEGRAEGRVTGKLELLKELMSNMKWTAEQAMQAAGLTAEEKAELAGMLND